MQRTRTLLPLLASVGLVALTGCGDVDAVGEDFALDQAPVEAFAPAEELAARGPSPRLERRLEHMTELLELDEAQVAQVRPILEAAQAQRQAGEREVHESVREQLEGVLDETQQARFDEMRARHRERRAARREGRGHQGRGHHGPGRFLERMQERLELSDAEVEQVRPILAAAHERRRELRGLARQERRAAMQALHSEVRGELAAVLSAEHLEALDEMHERMRARHEARRGRHGRGGPGGAGPNLPQGI